MNVRGRSKKNGAGKMTRAPEGTRAQLVTLCRPLGAQLRRPRFDRRQQRLVGQMAVAGRALVIGMPENLPDGEQIDAGVDHETGRAMAQIVDAPWRGQSADSDCYRRRVNASVPRRRKG